MKLVRGTTPTTTSHTRAEEARQRRTQTSQQRVTKAKSSITKAPTRAAKTAPVTVRGTRGLASTPVHGKKRPAPRRQFYYSLDATGAEVRLPSVPMIHPGWRLLSGALVLALAFLIYLAYNDARFQVGMVEFDGLKRLKAAEVTEVLDLNNLPIFMVDPDQVKQMMAISFPELTDVKIITGLPAVLKIEVTERQPALAWKFGETTYWVDKSGYIFPTRGEVNNLTAVEADSQPPVLITEIPLTGDEEQAAAQDKPAKPEIIGQTLDPTMLKAVQSLSKKMPEGASLIYTVKDGLGWNDPGGWKVYVGMDLQNINLKLKVYQAVIKKLSEDGITPVLVSVENVNAPFYRME